MWRLWELCYRYMLGFAMIEDRVSYRPISCKNYVNSIVIDWLRFSFPASSFAAVVAFLELPFELAGWLDGQRYRKKFWFPVCEGVLLAADAVPAGDGLDLAGAGSGRFVLDFSGNGLGVFFDSRPDLAPAVVIAGLLELGGRCTRLDVAFDDYQGLVKIPAVIRKLSAGELVTRWQSYSVIQSAVIGGGDLGTTVYVGSRSSDSFLRVYNKRLEEIARGGVASSLPACWVRVELELKGDRSQSVALELATSGSPAGLLRGFLLSLVDFKCSGGDSNVYRRASCCWWSKFLGSVTRCPISLARPVRSIERTRQWLERSVAGSLAMVHVYTGADWQYVNRLIKLGSSRLDRDKLVRMEHGS